MTDYIKTKKINDITPKIKSKGSKKLYIETYGCQMNVADSELVVSILADNGFTTVEDINQADVIFVNTCSIRDNAEQRIRGRLQVFKKVKKSKPHLIIGVIGCMAERLKDKLLEQEKLIDIIVGPDAYRDLPNLIKTAESGQKAVNVLLSREETYADISPVRYSSNGITAFISIMRGCDNMCSYCVVPFTRGRERSRNPESIIAEAKDLVKNGYKEVTLLGQNVDKYNWINPETNETVNFAKLLELTAKVSPDLRVRFSTSYPQDMTDEVLYTIAKYKNICKHIHFPAQSGSSRILEKMKRGYTREWYESRIKAIKTILPDCAVTTDIISGFCTETEDDHKQTLSLLEFAQFDLGFMFKYSERPNTYAARNFTDDVPEEIKSRRLTEIIDLQNKISEKVKQQDVGKIFEVLVEGTSKKSENELFGRTSQNKVVVFPKENYKKGDYVNVKVEKATSATLIGKAIKQ